MTLGPNLNSGASPRKRPVAAYLRSATQLEGNPLREQLEAIVRYARDRDMQLTRIYCDECGSGLTTDGCSSLQQMLSDIESGTDDFDAILLLDPSRWGRFQDLDRTACLEYACRQARIDVHYCAEGFGECESLLSGISNSPKRALATEYERESAARKRRGASAATSDTATPSGGTAARTKIR